MRVMERFKRIDNGWLVTYWEGNTSHEMAYDDEELIAEIEKEKEEREKK